jgi:hypothetical protein
MAWVITCGRTLAATSVALAIAYNRVLLQRWRRFDSVRERLINRERAPRPPLQAWPFAAGADHHARACNAAGRRGLSCLPDAGRQFAGWGDTDEGRHILVAVARYLATHSPTERAALQTADIARRLMRGRELHQSAEAS